MIAREFVELSKRNGAHRSAIMIGEQSLLLSCGEIWLSAGNSLQLVVSDNAEIKAWCNSKNIDCLPWISWAGSAVEKSSCDYLFSLANLRVLPQSVLDIAGMAAINFHDGPLPFYRGINSPSWAIINGETTHGIAFHLMTEAIDDGDIVVQKQFSVSAHETSLTLNAKCFEAANIAFGEIVQQLAVNSLNSTPQLNSTTDSFFYRERDRPVAIIDWTSPAIEIDRLVRALDFGDYENPLCIARIDCGISYVHVHHSKVTDTEREYLHPGRVVEIARQNLTVECATGCITLSGFTDVNGHSLTDSELASLLKVSAGDILPRFTDLFKRALDQAVFNEGVWKKRLVDLQPVEIPYRNSETVVEQRSERLESLQKVLSSSGQLNTTAAIAALLARLSDQTDFDLSVYKDHPILLKEQSETTSVLLSQLVQMNLPVRVSLNNNTTIDELEIQLKDTLHRVAEQGNYLRDLPLRLGKNRSTVRCPVTLILRVDTNAENVPEPEGDLCIIVSTDGKEVHWSANASALSDADFQRLQDQLAVIILDGQKSCEPIQALRLLTDDEYSNVIGRWNQTSVEFPGQTVHHAIESAAEHHAMDIAMVFEADSVTYEELNNRANAFSHQLTRKGIVPGQLIGVLMDRSIDMMVALLGILKTGCAYVPLDPVYPKDRLIYMVRDARVTAIVCDEALSGYIESGTALTLTFEPYDSSIRYKNPVTPCQTTDLAYVIYTSGSTGSPKGVMVEHRNVANFFVAMNHRIPQHNGVWLAVTSISFDISVLELFWTLTRGFKVVLYSDDRRQKSQPPLHSAFPEKQMDMSLFYWNVADESNLDRNDKYHLLLEGARFADQNGFRAVWNPERHFEAFGGSFPNPAVTCAAVAAITKNVAIRAGSCVAPLHSPIRIAEDWSVVDNLSNGRAGVAFAAGWAPPDFAILPENFKNAKDVMFTHLDTVRKLWRGDKVEFEGPLGTVDVRTLPRPVQPELPVWITTAGNIESYRMAGVAGANILTHLLGQTVDDVAEKIAAYHQAWDEADHQGRGQITLMLHTLIGHDKESVRRLVHQPMKAYLKSAMFLLKSAAWNFPTFKKLSDDTGATLDSFFENISDEDMDALLDHAFDRYFNHSGLFGSVADGIKMIDSCKRIGVDEIACLIDFGLDDQKALDHLPFLAELREAVNSSDQFENESADYSIAAQISRHNVTHLQCTPSMAAMLLADPESKGALESVQHILVGGEALPQITANELSESGALVSNMYGPTESTIWSSTASVEKDQPVLIGSPVANTWVYVVDRQLQLVPPGMPGELLIGGAGVVRGYHNMPELTEERFIPDAITPKSGSLPGRLYRTGDLVRQNQNGNLQYLGRLDHQVKIHGYRIELEEIEAQLCQNSMVSQATVILREDTPGDQRLVAYIVASADVEIMSNTLQSKLKEKLPEFMVPSIIVQLNEMPLTPNGKTDRSKLPVPARKQVAGHSDRVKPANDLEIVIAKCWKDVLKLEEVGTTDNFFDIGGHSLLVIELLKRLNSEKRIEKTVAMTDVFRFSTVAGLAAHLTETDVQQAEPTGQSRAQSRKSAMNRRRRASR